MVPKTPTATSCTCEQLCMVKGAKFWLWQDVPGMVLKGKKYKMGVQKQCTCFAEDNEVGITEVKTNWKKIKKAKKKFQHGKKGWYLGEIKRLSLAADGPIFN